MAIATVERDSTRGSGASEPRFKLLEEICRAGDLQFWRATDRRNGKPCVVRVIDAGREESSRRLGDLHRERLLAERIPHACVLRPDVPLIEGERIYQLVHPEPARRIESAQDDGRLTVLNLLANAAAALAEAHARGAFHGALSRDSLLRSAEGRVILQGFTGDATNAATARDGAAADHQAFLLLAQDLLAPTGGPPPRLRRYFARELAPGAARPAAGAMQSLAEELRDSLEDTFPWPAAAAPTAAEEEGGTARLPAIVVAGSNAAARSAVSKARTETAAAALAPKAKPSEVPKVQRALPAAKRAPAHIATAPQPVDEPPRAPAAAASAPARVTVPIPLPVAASASTTAEPVPRAPVVVSESRMRLTRADDPGKETAAPAPASRVRAEAAISNGVEPREVSRDDVEVTEPPRRSLRPWITIAVLVGVLVAGWQYGQRRHAADAAPAASESSPAGAPPSQPVSPADPASPQLTDGPDAAPQRGPDAGASASPPATTLPATTPTAASAPEPLAATPAAAAASAPRARTDGNLAATRTERRATASAPSQATRDAASERTREAAAAQATRSRVANLVAGGNRALNALEPQIAAEAFAQALALAPGDRAATEGNQRARRLLGAAALVRDAREAAARGDHGRAVQGYSQALANDPRNRGLAEALAASRRSLARDETGTLIAAGHEALGAGRLEQARDAFERALQLDPRDVAARRAAEQAATAILLRDTANERRLAANSPEG